MGLVYRLRIIDGFIYILMLCLLVCGQSTISSSSGSTDSAMSSSSSSTDSAMSSSSGSTDSAMSSSSSSTDSAMTSFPSSTVSASSSSNSLSSDSITPTSMAQTPSTTLLASGPVATNTTSAAWSSTTVLDTSFSSGVTTGASSSSSTEALSPSNTANSSSSLTQAFSSVYVSSTSLAGSVNTSATSIAINSSTAATAATASGATGNDSAIASSAGIVPTSTLTLGSTSSLPSTIAASVTTASSSPLPTAPNTTASAPTTIQGIDHCNTNPCQHSGNCTSSVNGYNCSCALSWGGVNCTEEINYCDPNPCQNQGTCHVDLDKPLHYFCNNCKSGWTGQNCSIYVPFCDAKPCVHGLCSELKENYTCACEPGYSGTNCDQDINECETTLNLCPENSTCANKNGSFECNCNEGFEKLNGYCKTIILWRDYNITNSRKVGSTVVTINTTIPFPYFNSSFRQISGYINGYISLGSGNLLSRPPFVSNWPAIPVYLGVYWASIDDTQGLNNFYVTEDKTKLENASAESSLLNHIKKNLGEDDFEPLYAVAFTWKDVQPKPAVNYTNDKATFQIILATDGILSYAIKNYETVWEKVNLVKRPLVAPTYTWNGKELVKDLLVNNPTKINVKFFENKIPNLNNLECIRNVQQLLIQVGNDKNLLPACPCNKKQILEDFRFNNTSESTCYENRFTYDTVSSLKQKCCYDSFGLLIKNTKDAGIPLPLEHNNILEICNSALYEWFFSKYPTSDCSTYKSTVIGFGFGDPHLITFDGNKYTFQGLGDYVLFKSGDIQLIGRTKKSDNANTTYFSEYAFKPPVLDNIFQFSAKDNAILGQFKDLNGPSNLLTTSDFHSISVITASCTIKISEKSGTLSHQIYVYSDNFTTVGLMGSRDMNKSNDFLLQNGTLLEGTAAEVDGLAVNEFVESWRLNSTEELLFFSTLGPNNSGFKTQILQNSIERIKEDLRNKTNSQVAAMADELCLDDLFCLQDYYTQGDNDSAIETRNQSLMINNIIDQLLRQPPVFSNSIQPININQSVPFSLILKVEGNKTVQFSKEGFASVSGLSLENNSFSWNLTAGLADLRKSSYPLSLTFNAADEYLNTTYKPPINICLCDKTAQCQFLLSSPDDNNGVVNGNVRIVPCECDERSTGKFCELKADICQNCYNRSGCNDTLVKYCPDCPAGYDGDGKECLDIDECATNNGGCEQICSNTEGSYHCSCYSGYTQNNTACNDINECNKEDICSNEFQNCINKEGGYDCKCSSGRWGPDCIKAPYSYLGSFIFSSISEKWTSDLLNKSSAQFQTFSGQVTSAIQSALNKSSSIKSTFYIEVISFEIYSRNNNVTQNTGRKKRETSVDPILAQYIIYLTKYVAVEAIKMALENLSDSNCLSNCRYGNLIITSILVNDSANLCDFPSTNICDPLSSGCQSSNHRISCSCKKGFEQNPFDQYSCKDIDECKLATSCTATEFCKNEIGTYLCVCEVGKTWDVTNLTCILDKCSTNPCKNGGTCILTPDEPGYACKCTYEWDGTNCEDENTDARRLRIAVICVSVILGFFCLCLLIILIVVCAKNRRRGSDWTLDSHAYTNSRYNNGDGLPRPKVKTYGGRSVEMAENGRGGNEYSSLDQDEDKKMSFGRHASGQEEKEGGKYFVNKAFDNTEVIQERL